MYRVALHLHAARTQTPAAVGHGPVGVPEQHGMDDHGTEVVLRKLGAEEPIASGARSKSTSADPDMERTG